MFLFCFYGYGAHRDLHVLTLSFPTRRSSDLCLGWLGSSNRMYLGGVMYAGPGVGIFVSGLAGSAMFDHGWHSRPAWIWCAVLALASSLLIWRIIGRSAPSVVKAVYVDASASVSREPVRAVVPGDRKSTRLNSSH